MVAGTVEYEIALAELISAEDEKEKRTAVAESKERIYDIMAQEFPSEVQCLYTSSLTNKELAVITTRAQKPRAVHECLENLKSDKHPVQANVQAKGVSTALGAVLKAKFINPLKHGCLMNDPLGISSREW